MKKLLLTSILVMSSMNAYEFDFALFGLTLPTESVTPTKNVPCGHQMILDTMKQQQKPSSPSTVEQAINKIIEIGKTFTPTPVCGHEQQLQMIREREMQKTVKQFTLVAQAILKHLKNTINN